MTLGWFLIRARCSWILLQMLASAPRLIKPRPAGLSHIQSCICHTQMRMSATTSFQTGPRLINKAEDT